MKKEELLKELREKFDSLQKELKFKSSFDEINSIFFIEDHALQIGFVSENYSRQLCSRIVDNFGGWAGYVHGFLMPHNPTSMMESKILDEKDKKELNDIFKNLMAFSSKNSEIGITKDKVEERKFIDDAVSFWNKSFKGTMIRILKKINEAWKK